MAGLALSLWFVVRLFIKEFYLKKSILLDNKCYMTLEHFY